MRFSFSLALLLASLLYIPTASAQYLGCGASANSGRDSTPTANMCVYGSQTGNTIYNNEARTYHRQCMDANSVSVSCQARNTASVQPTPACLTWTYETFAGNRGCSIGSMTNRRVDVLGRATWQCTDGSQTTSLCNTPKSLADSGTNLGTSCNPTIANKSYDTTYDLLTNHLCANNTYPKAFDIVGDKRKRTCGVEQCEATKTSASMCSRATKKPRQTYPSDGLCTSGLVSSVKSSNSQRGWLCTTNLTNIQKFENSSCTTQSCILSILDMYNGKTALCTAPRTTPPACKRETQISPYGFASPDALVQAGLCESGTPTPLIPRQDTVAKKRAWQCTNTTMNQTTPVCYAKVGLPIMSVVNKPIVNTYGVTTHVVASVTGFDPLYISFVDPVGQAFRLFTANGSFTFRYQDRAGNTGSLVSYVDGIGTNAPVAKVVYSTTATTAGSVTVSLSGFNRTNGQIPTITFTSTCLSNNTCTKVTTANPNIFSIIFAANGAGTFTLMDSDGTTTLPVSVTWIDTLAPLANVIYSPASYTRDPVQATIVSSEPIRILNNNGQSGYLFSGNGSFVRQIQDMAGNIGYVTGKVDWIRRDAPSAKVIYTTTSRTSVNVTASLSEFTTPGTIITNNNGSASKTFVSNGEFVFLLRDPAGNIGSVRAVVDNIDKPVGQDLIAQYNARLCPYRSPSPSDITNDANAFGIYTLINNCVLGTTKKGSKHLFRPTATMTRGEYLDMLGILIMKTTTYTGSIAPAGVNQTTTRGQYIYYTVYGNKKLVVGQTMTRDEAVTLLSSVLILIGRDDLIATTLLPKSSKLTRSQISAGISKILVCYDDVALGDHHTFLRTYMARIAGLSVNDRQKVTIDQIKKIHAMTTKQLARAGLDRSRLLEDLAMIAAGNITPRQKPIAIDTSVTSIVDDVLR